MNVTGEQTAEQAALSLPRSFGQALRSLLDSAITT